MDHVEKRMCEDEREFCLSQGEIKGRYTGS